MASDNPDHVPSYDFCPPPGAHEGRVRACAKTGCGACAALARRLDAARGDAPATARGDASLQAFAGGDA